MKNVLIAVLILTILAGGGYFFLQSNRTAQTPVSDTSPTQTVQANPTAPITADAFCTPSQLEALLDPEVAAGNLYAQITLKNISDTTCQVVGNNTLEVGYPDSVKNFQTVTKRQPTTSIFTLAPNQTIYALIHYPNGPQCSSEATDVNAMVSYEISDNNSVSFKPTMGSTLDIPSCGKATDITTIDLYPFSDAEVTP